MCYQNNITSLISSSYTILCFIIPLIYILIYRQKAKHIKKVSYRKCFIIAFFIFGLLLLVKVIAFIDKDSCFNCYINNICAKESGNLPNDSTTTTSSTTTSSTTTTTSSTTTSSTTKLTTKTTTTKKLVEKTYAKIPEPSGNKKVVGTTSKGYTIYEIDGVTYIDGYLIANKTYALPKDYVPKNTYTSAEGKTNTCNTCINNIAYEAWKDMKADAAAVGLNIYISSGYRPYQTQKTLYDRYVARDGKAAADTYSARAGHSEHQSGECFDLNSITDVFANTPEGKWVAQNAYKYGYIIRYPQGKSDETGYKYESWHLRYVGTDLSYKLYNNGNWITMEDYYGFTSKYAN